MKMQMAAACSREYKSAGRGSGEHIKFRRAQRVCERSRRDVERRENKRREAERGSERSGELEKSGELESVTVPPYSFAERLG